MKIYDQNNKKIGFFCTIPLEYGGGAETITIQTAKALSAKKGYNVSILALNNDPTLKKINPISNITDTLQYGEKITKDQNRYTTESINARLGKATYRRMSIWEAIKKMKTMDYLFVKNDLPYLLPVFLAVVTKPSFRNKVIIQFHTPLYYWGDKSFRGIAHNLIYTSPFYNLLIYSISKRFHVLNAAEKKAIKGSSLIKIPCDDIFFSHEKTNKLIGSKKTIIMAGRLTHQKGIDMLPSLLRYLNKRKALDSFKFIIAGSGDMEHIVKKLKKEYKGIKFIHNIDHEQMPNFLAKGNIFLMLSRFEGSPVILAEAMALGLLILSFDIPGIISKKNKEYIHTAPAFDIKAIADELIKISNTKNQAIKEAAVKNSEYALRNYTMDVYIKKIENLMI